MKTAERLTRALARSHDGQPWHGPSRSEILADVTWEEAAWRAADGAHSIWDLVLHMRSWTREVTRRLGGAVPAEPVDGDWPDPGAKGAAAWQQALASLEAAHAELGRAVRALDEDALAAKVTPRAGEKASDTISKRSMVGSLVEHDIYHSGQCAMLKRLARTLR